MDVARARLHNQRLSSAGLARPVDVVRWLGAVQAQDYPGAKWALALRMRRTTDRAIERAFTAGEILRTHVMRPTWHFVAPADIRWMLALSAHRVRASLAHYDRRLGIDTAVIRRSEKAMTSALKGGVQLTRQELKVVLQKTGVVADGVQRLAHLMMHAELDGMICSGPLRGRQFTYALLDERVPEPSVLQRHEALAELTRRYFTSHGPAQLQDFVWWSGLTTADARIGLEMARHHLADEVIGARRYWFSSSVPRISRPRRKAYLLPLYDEYLIAYKDRSASIKPAHWTTVTSRDPLSAPIVIDGQVVGGWKRTLVKDRVTIAANLPVRQKKAETDLVVDAAREFGTFLGLDVTLVRR
jgi:winged helix DNA-binding protein